MGGPYKVLAKVLAKRRKNVTRKVVSKSCSLIKGRQILDVVLIANEAIDSMLKSDTCVVCKVDIENAYDHVFINS